MRCFQRGNVFHFVSELRPEGLFVVTDVDLRGQDPEDWTYAIITVRPLNHRGEVDEGREPIEFRFDIADGTTAVTPCDFRVIATMHWPEGETPHWAKGTPQVVLDKLAELLGVDHLLRRDVEDIFRRAFPNSAIEIDDSYQGRLHVKLVTPDLNGKGEAEKQRFVMDILDAELDEERASKVSLVLAYGMDEVF